MKLQAPILISLADDGRFPNNRLPVIWYKSLQENYDVDLSTSFKTLFGQNNWRNQWEAGIFTFHHYHSNTHEVMGVSSGHTEIQLGGNSGRIILLSRGDVLILPAGTAHKNLGAENQICCIGAYPEGRTYDMNYGEPGERPKTDAAIESVPLPLADPVYGPGKGISAIWTEYMAR